MNITEAVDQVHRMRAAVAAPQKISADGLRDLRTRWLPSARGAVQLLEQIVAEGSYPTYDRDEHTTGSMLEANYGIGYWPSQISHLVQGRAAGPTALFWRDRAETEKTFGIIRDTVGPLTFVAMADVLQATVIMGPFNLHQKGDIGGPNPVPLGRFEARFELRTNGQGYAVLERLKALEPHHPVCNSGRPILGYVHPNVKMGRGNVCSVCWGAGEATMRTSYENGDLLPLVLTLEAVLATNGSANPYFPLQDWYGKTCECPACQKAFRVAQSPGSFSCGNCGRAWHRECTPKATCGCGTRMQCPICISGTGMCGECGTKYCSGCSLLCDYCSARRCTACVKYDEKVGYQGCKKCKPAWFDKEKTS